MKKILKKLINGIKEGIKKIPGKVYLFIFVTLLVVGLQSMLFRPFMGMAEAHKNFFVESTRVLSQKSSEDTLMDELFQAEKSVRDSYIDVDLNSIGNPFSLIKAYLLMSFAKIDIIGQCFIALGFLLVDWKLIKLAFKFVYARRPVKARKASRKQDEKKTKAEYA